MPAAGGGGHHDAGPGPAGGRSLAEAARDSGLLRATVTGSWHTMAGRESEPTSAQGPYPGRASTTGSAPCCGTTLAHWRPNVPSLSEVSRPEWVHAHEPRAIRVSRNSTAASESPTFAFAMPGPVSSALKSPDESTTGAT
jgi:hypothetical protein